MLCDLTYIDCLAKGYERPQGVLILECDERIRSEFRALIRSIAPFLQISEASSIEEAAGSLHLTPVTLIMARNFTVRGRQADFRGRRTLIQELSSRGHPVVPVLQLVNDKAPRQNRQRIIQALRPYL